MVGDGGGSAGSVLSLYVLYEGIYLQGAVLRRLTLVISTSFCYIKGLCTAGSSNSRSVLIKFSYILLTTWDFSKF